MGDKWRELKFGDCAELVRDTCQPNESFGKPYIGLEHIEQGTLRLNSAGIAEDVTSTKSNFKRGDILFGKLRPYFRKVVRPKIDGICSTDIWVVRAKNGVDQGFLFYWMASKEFVDIANQGAEGTKMPRAKWDFVSKVKQQIPPLPEQKAIASVLGALDDKIELNRKMNETLEAVARAIFKSWFVDFDPIPGIGPHKEWQDSPLGKIPKGWRVGKVSDIADVSSGTRPEFRQNIATADCCIPLYGGGGQMGFVPLPLYKEPILLTGRVGTLGQIHRIVCASWPSDNTLVIRPYKQKTFEYLYFSLKNIDFDSLNRGSTQPLVTQSDLKQQSIAIPHDDVLQHYNDIAYQLFLHIDANDDQSCTLATIRDTLLPKLLSGEVRVKEAERFVEKSAP